MNKFAVQDAWKKHYAQLEAEASRRMRDAAAWVARSFPSLCESGNADPVLLLAVMRLKAETPSVPVTKAAAVGWARTYHQEMRDRGFHDDEYLAEDLNRLETA